MTAPSTRCAICGKPILWVPVIGWTHATFTDLDHDAEEAQ